MTKKKSDALNDGKWDENDEKNYRSIVAIVSPNDFDESGRFTGGAEKRRKVTLARSKFNASAIQNMKSREKSTIRSKTARSVHKKSDPKAGEGLEENFIPYNQNIVYEYYDDPNELCERLKLLLASKSAGNSNHDQEISSIIEELRDRNIMA